MDYSGFNRSSWAPRTREAHQSAIVKILACNTKAGVATVESEHGYRHSVLLKLPYQQQCLWLTQCIIFSSELP